MDPMHVGGEGLDALPVEGEEEKAPELSSLSSVTSQDGIECPEGASPALTFLPLDDEFDSVAVW